MRYDAYRERKYFANLDGVRFVCIAMVLWHHHIPTGPDAPLLFSRGFLGVDFFFLLSGFLITTLLLRERSTYGSFSLRDFYQRRIVRIFPVYYFVVCAVAAYYILIDGRTELAHLVPYYLLFLSNYLTEHIPLLGITWSVSIEEQYYMIWPLLLLLVPARWLVPLLLALIAVNVAGIMGVFNMTGWQIGAMTLRLPNSTFAPIIMGSLLAVLLHSRNGFALMEKALGWRWAAAVAFILLVLALQFPGDDLRGLPNLLIHTTMVATLAALVVREDNAAMGFLRIRAVARVGTVSYGIYLYHLIALDIVLRVLNLTGMWASSWLTLLSYCVLSYIMAEISFRTLESYFQRFRPAPRPRPKKAPSPQTVS